MSKELHCLAQGKEGVTVGINTIFYLTHAKIGHIPKECTVTYASIVIDHHPQKDNRNQVQITVGGNLINYLYELTIRTANYVKQCHQYPRNPLNQHKYMQMPLKLFLDDIIDHYNLQ
jgi:hypothetical protein